MDQDSNPDLILSNTFIPLCHNTDLSVHFFPISTCPPYFQLTGQSQMQSNKFPPGFIYLIKVAYNFLKEFLGSLERKMQIRKYW